MNTLDFHNPNRLDLILAIFFGLLLASLASSCVSDSNNSYYDNWIITQPVVIDTPCIPVEVIHPDFLTMYLDLDEPQTPVTFTAGAYSVTLFLDEPGKADSMIAVLKKFAPQYEYKIYMTDWFKFAVFIEGTNDKTIFQLKVHTRSDELNQWPTFSVQAFFFGGILTYAEYLDVIKHHPSCRSFNFRLLASTQSQRDTLSLAILGDYPCQLGRYWADFRNTPVTDTIPPLFVNVGWDNTLQLAGPWYASRGYAQEGAVLDLSNRCVTDDELITLLDQGYTVITRA